MKRTPANTVQATVSAGVFYLQKARHIAVGEGLYTVAGKDCLSFFDVVYSKDYISGAGNRRGESVDIFNIDACILYNFEDLLQGACLVAHAGGDDLGLGDDYIVGEDFFGLFDVGDDEPENSEISGIRDGQSANVDSCVGDAA